MIRLILIFLVVFLITRLFVVYGSDRSGEKKESDPLKKSSTPRKGVPKGIGEYVEFEELEK
jgi:hypothetical protein